MKILIIGAGPIGCYTARLLKEKNSRLDIEIIEEHAQIGKPVHCAGLVSGKVLSEVKLSLGEDIVINHIHGAKFFLNGDSFSINRRDVAVVIDREKFDRALGDSLAVKFDTRVVGIEKENGGYLVETDKGEFFADIVIGADGASSVLRKIGGFKENIEYLRGVQFRIKYNGCDRNFVQVYFRRPFFAWVIPEGNDIIRAGIISSNPYHDLTSFLKEANIKGEILEKFAGVAPLGSCATCKENLFLVGDAACQIKPLTHGGIYYGMRCAEILVDCIAKNRPHNYEKKWRAKFEREIRIGLKMRQMYQRLTQHSLIEIFNFFKKNTDLVERFGDFENHSKIIYALIKNSQLRNFLGDVLLHLF